MAKAGSLKRESSCSAFEWGWQLLATAKGN